MKKCVKEQKADFLNMGAWYPACGLYAEQEKLCTKHLIQGADEKCGAQFDGAARVAQSVPSDVLL